MGLSSGIGRTMQVLSGISSRLTGKVCLLHPYGLYHFGTAEAKIHLRMNWILLHLIQPSALETIFIFVLSTEGTSMLIEPPCVHNSPTRDYGSASESAVLRNLMMVVQSAMAKWCIC
jgi:hypothetical protein